MGAGSQSIGETAREGGHIDDVVNRILERRSARLSAMTGGQSNQGTGGEVLARGRGEVAQFPVNGDVVRRTTQPIRCEILLHASVWMCRYVNERNEAFVNAASCECEVLKLRASSNPSRKWRSGTLALQVTMDPLRFCSSILCSLDLESSSVPQRSDEMEAISMTDMYANAETRGRTSHSSTFAQNSDVACPLYLADERKHLWQHLSDLETAVKALDVPSLQYAQVPYDDPYEGARDQPRQRPVARDMIADEVTQAKKSICFMYLV